jgi:uncharacterized protein YggE
MVSLSSLRLLRALSAAAWLTACGGHTTVVEAPRADEAAQGLSVMGQGEARGSPDIARVNLGVEARAAQAADATTQAKTIMASVLSAVKQQGVADKDIRTEQYNVHFERRPEPPYPPPPPVPLPRSDAPTKAPTPAARVATPAKPLEPEGWYRVTNIVEVTVRQIDKTGAIIEAATRAGSNQVWGIRFELDDPRKLEAEARSKAVADAKARAEELARLGGVRLGPIISMSEEGGGPGPMYAAKAMDESAQAVPVEKGELTVTRMVRIVYSLPDAEKATGSKP